ncbi:MAG: hypothetical protein AAFS13_08365, partial [Pseudomonadota bacterium]
HTGPADQGGDGETGVHIAEHVPSKWKLRKASTRLKALETLVRRLIMLLALEVEWEPKAPRAVQTKPDPHKIPETIDGVETVEFPNARQRGLSLMPRIIDISERLDVSHLPRRSTPIHISTKRFARRIVALQKVLEAPEAHAKRLARHLSKLQKSKEPAPVLIPLAIPNGLAPEIGLLSGGLAMRLGDALEVWASERPEIDPGDRFQRRRPGHGP